MECPVLRAVIRFMAKGQGHRPCRLSTAPIDASNDTIRTFLTPVKASRSSISSHLDLISFILSAKPLAATIFRACSMMVEHSTPITLIRRHPMHRTTDKTQGTDRGTGMSEDRQMSPKHMHRIVPSSHLSHSNLILSLHPECCSTLV